MTTRKILFLDIDGVLTSYACDEALDPRCLRRLDEIVARTGAEVVISSSWRATHTTEEIAALLRAEGFTGQVAGATPVLLGKTRGEEIAAFLDGHAPPPGGFALLDDVDDLNNMARLADRLVLTDEFVGLQDADVERAVALLGQCGHARPRFDKLLLLDLDETLVHVSQLPPPAAPARDPDFEIGLCSAYTRPGVEHFLKTVVAWFRVGIYAAGTPPYVEEMVGRLFGDPSTLDFVCDRDRCALELDPTSGDEVWTKRLDRLPAPRPDRSKIIIVDDSPDAWPRDRDNLLVTPRYDGREDEDALDRLLVLLERIGASEDVRHALGREVVGGGRSPDTA